VSFSYDPALDTDLDWVRFLIGDKTTPGELFQDEEINAVLAEEGNKYLAAARLGDVMLSMSHGIVEKAVDDLRLRWSESPQSAYRQYLSILREKGARLTYKEPALFRVI